MHICDEKMCTGCSTCSVKCPRNAIRMQQDSEGFFRPFIDNNLCIECQCCKQVCPSNQENTRNYGMQTSAYAYMNQDVEVKRKSSSGGAFIALAQYVISHNGAVFGATFDNNYYVRLTKAEFLHDVYPMMGSKYVESLVGDSYSEVEQLIDQGKMVLFTGLPCQIAGLYSFLGEKAGSDLLFTVDLLCHGVPSSKLFTSYISTIEEQLGKIERYTFRDKSKWGWGAWGSITYKKGNKRKIKMIQPATDYYYGLFYKENCFREACYECKYASLPRIGDITIGDYWGIERQLPLKTIRDGVSLVLVNNEHAKTLLEQVRMCDELYWADIHMVCDLNKTIVEPAQRPSSRDYFYQGLEKLGFVENAKKYVKVRSIIPVIARYIPKRLKIILRKIK